MLLGLGVYDSLFAMTKRTLCARITGFAFAGRGIVRDLTRMGIFLAQSSCQTPTGLPTLREL
jgi:hypothetical protein